MKRLLTISLLLVMATGCMHEKYDHCPPEEGLVRLAFRLDDGNGGDKFASTMQGVDLAIYNDEGVLLRTQNISQAQLSQYQGVTMSIPVGTYHVVAWGNIAGNSTYADHADGARVTYQSVSNGEVGNSDKLYYAPRTGGRTTRGATRAAPQGSYTMTVDTQGHNGVLDFTAAHRTLNIWCEGLNFRPQVEITNIPQGLGWHGMGRLTNNLMQELNVASVQLATQVTQDSKLYDYASFDTFWFDENNQITINIVDPNNGDTLKSVFLNEVYDWTTNNGEISLSFLFDFTNGPAAVEITVPKWGRDEVEPGLGV